MEDTSKIITSAAGCLFLAQDTNRLLFAQRSEPKSHYGAWGLWGGKQEINESVFDCLQREIYEEMGHIPEALKIFPFDVYESANQQFMYHTYIWVTPREFIPRLNSENDGYAWVKIGRWPEPLHSGAKLTLSVNKNVAKLQSMGAESPDIATLPCITNSLHKFNP